MRLRHGRRSRRSFARTRRSSAATSWRWCATGRSPRICCSHTFYDALRAGDQLDAVANERAWLYGIARHRALRALRRGRRFQRLLVRLAGSREATAEGDEGLVALLDLLERELSPDLRALVLLRYAHGFRAAELATMTGLSSEAVRQRLARARTRLIAKEEGR